MLRMLVTTEAGDERDLSRYVDWTSLKITTQLSVPSQLTVDFYQYDQEFIPPFERCYVRLWSDKDARTVFTGYVAVTPDIQFIAFNPIQQFFKYSVTCTSDEYLLNFKSIPYIPAFINQTQGQILAQLAEILCPGFYDTSRVQPGFLVPYFAYDPTQTWSTIAKTFGDAARYYYFCKDKAISYVPYNDADFGIRYDEVNDPPTRWNSSKLATTVLQVPTVNDATIIGDVEAGNSHDDYFVGDGFTGEYKLNYATFQSRTALLLEDDFTQTSLNTQNWTLNDPQNNFDFSAGAFNIVSPISGPVTTGQLIANNGIELAGGLELQHGEFQWNDQSVGEVGGIYFDVNALVPLSAFEISTPIPSAVVLTASGAGGIAMQPSLSGQLIGPQIISQPNHHYVLNTKIAASAETRFQQTFATKDGTYFGGQQSAVYGDITYSIEDVDIGATYNQSLTGIYNFPVASTTTFTATGVLLPAYAAYALAKNGQLNLTANYCLLSKTPAGSLRIAGSTSGAFVPTGAILPFLGPEAEYYGPVSPYLSGQIVLSSGVTGSLAAPTPLLTPQLHTLGFGLDTQDASITQSGTNNNQDTLGFYLTTTPSAGSRVRFRSNEAQRSQSRVIDALDVAYEAALVGDDGRRAVVVSDMSPLPRTSEDCDAAAQAYIYDREQIFYNGTYTAESDLLEQIDSDFPYYPIPGRMLNVNCPARNLEFNDFLVTKVVTTPLDPVGESLSYAITFGADTRTEKLLSVFTPQQPKNIYTPLDAANIPSPQMLSLIASGTYLPDLTDIDAAYIIDQTVYFEIYSPALTGSLVPPHVYRLPGYAFTPIMAIPQPLLPISTLRSVGGSVAPPVPVSITVPATTGLLLPNPIQRLGPGMIQPTNFNSPLPLPGNLYVEIRLSDQGWGLNTSNLVARFSVNIFTLPKNNIDQTWYMRFVQIDPAGNTIMMSRRTKVVRIFYPFRPSPPNVIYATTADIQLDFAGDQRNIYGVELRTGDDETVMFQQGAVDTAELYFNLQQILPQLKQIAKTGVVAAATGYSLTGTAMPWLTPSGIGLANNNATYFPFGVNDGTPPLVIPVPGNSVINITASGTIFASTQQILTGSGVIPSTAAPWVLTGGRNSAYTYGQSGETSPILVPVTGGVPITIEASGIMNPGPGLNSTDPNGTLYWDAGAVVSPTLSGTFNGTVYFPTLYMYLSQLGVGGLCGAFADASGNVIQPVSIGPSATLIPPTGAAFLQLGINDTYLSDNTGFFTYETYITAPQSNDPNGLSTPTASGMGPTNTNYPTLYMPNSGIGVGGLVGALVDANGNVLEPISLGTTTDLQTPAGTGLLLALGINSDSFAANTGSFTVSVSADENLFLRGYTARFFNSQWLYSTPTRITIPPPNPPVISVGTKFAQAVTINSDVDTSRDDIVQQSLEVNGEPFLVWNTGVDPNPALAQQILTSDTQPGSYSFTTASTGSLWVRSRRADLLGWGAYSPSLYIPQTDLIASNYLTTQGSVPPSVTNQYSALFSYTSTTGSITVVSLPFGVTFPDGTFIEVASATKNFISASDVNGVTGRLQPGTSYDYFPYLDNPGAANSQLEMGMLYSEVPTSVLATLIADGKVTFSNTPLIAATAPPLTSGGSGGQGGGSSGGGSNGGGGGGDSTILACTEVHELVTMADNSKLAGLDIKPGHILLGPGGKNGRVKSVRIHKNVNLLEVTTNTGRTLKGSDSHALKVNRCWASFGELCERHSEGERLYIHTVDDLEEIVSFDFAGVGDIVDIELVENKIYYVNGFESHNTFFRRY